MQFTEGALLISGGVIQAGVAYPWLATSRPGWKIGDWAGGTFWALWYGMGALAYLAGMVSVFGWFGLLAAIPLALLLGFAITMAIGRHTQIVALIGPVLANLWFMT